MDYGNSKGWVGVRVVCVCVWGGSRHLLIASLLCYLFKNVQNFHNKFWGAPCKSEVSDMGSSILIP